MELGRGLIDKVDKTLCSGRSFRIEGLGHVDKRCERTKEATVIELTIREDEYLGE